jgi:hypothetical protein
MPQGAAATPRPRAADIAFGLVLTAAACILVFGLMVPFQVGPALDRSRAEAEAHHVPLAALQQQLVVVAIVVVAVAVVLAGLLVLFAFRFRAGRRSARGWLVALTVVLVLTLYAPALLAAVLVLVADVLVFLRPVSEWLRAAERARIRA